MACNCDSDNYFDTWENLLSEIENPDENRSWTAAYLAYHEEHRRHDPDLAPRLSKGIIEMFEEEAGYRYTGITWDDVAADDAEQYLKGLPVSDDWPTDVTKAGSGAVLAFALPLLRDEGLEHIGRWRDRPSGEPPAADGDALPGLPETIREVCARLSWDQRLRWLLHRLSWTAHRVLDERRIAEKDRWRIADGAVLLANWAHGVPLDSDEGAEMIRDALRDRRHSLGWDQELRWLLNSITWQADHVMDDRQVDQLERERIQAGAVLLANWARGLPLDSDEGARMVRDSFSTDR